MAFDIYLLHVRKDREPAVRVATALDECGWKAWSDVMFSFHDDQMPEDGWLARVSCALALWSANSVEEDWMWEEANIAKEKGVLLQAVLDDVNPPLGFRDLQYADLREWNGDKDTVHFRALRDAISRFVKPKSRILLPDADTSASEIERRRAALAGRRIFLSYRRQDSQGETGRLHDQLTSAFGPDSVFMDVDNVPYGVDYVDYIHDCLSSVAVVIVVIGEKWAKVTDRRGRRRLDQPDDLVRLEIAEALRRKLPILPVLVQNAKMPDAEDLPEDIRAFARRNAPELSHTRWHHDMERLLHTVEDMVGG